MKPYSGKRPTEDELVEAHVLHAERTGHVYSKADRDKRQREIDELPPPSAQGEEN